MYELLIYQIHEFPLSINKTYSQLLLFIIGITVSVFFGYFMLPFIYTSEDLLWYIFGMIVPMLPSICNMERYLDMEVSC